MKITVQSFEFMGSRRWRNIVVLYVVAVCLCACRVSAQFAPRGFSLDEYVTIDYIGDGGEHYTMPKIYNNNGVKVPYTTDTEFHHFIFVKKRTYTALVNYIQHYPAYDNGDKFDWNVDRPFKMTVHTKTTTTSYIIKSEKKAADYADGMEKVLKKNGYDDKRNERVWGHFRQPGW
jgi:hypothetical protein